MGVETALIGGSAISAGASLFGADKAAKAQTKAAQIAAQTQMAMYNQNRADQTTYRNLGEQGGVTLGNRLTELTSPITMDQATLEQTPGYQFNLNQGLKAAQSSAAARGLGLSGAAIKGATNFATGLADSTYQNQFNNAQQNQLNAYNRLMGLTTIGQNAAAQTGTQGAVAGQGVAQAYTNAGNAQGAAAMGSANAIGGAANQIGQYYAFAPVLNRLTGLYSGAGQSSGGASDFSFGGPGLVL